MAVFDLIGQFVSKIYHSISEKSNCFMIFTQPLRSGRICIYIFTTHPALAGYDTRSIFKRSLTGLNSEFSFS